MTWRYKPSQQTWRRIGVTNLAKKNWKPTWQAGTLWTSPFSLSWKYPSWEQINIVSPFLRAFLKMNLLFSKVGYDSSLEGTSSFMMDFPASHSLVFFGVTRFVNLTWELKGAPPGMYQTLQTMGWTTYQVVQDFFHQQYCGRNPAIITTRNVCKTR